MESSNERASSPAESKFHIKDRTAENWDSSEAAQSLKRMQGNVRIKYVVVIVPDSACPACQQLAGTYPKDQAPHLPVEHCSHPSGCRSYYLPYLGDLYP